jgi:hypothetical protein
VAINRSAVHKKKTRKKTEWQIKWKWLDATTIVNGQKRKLSGGGGNGGDPIS